MYAFIKGQLIQKKEEFVVVENNGIGYKIFCLATTQERLGKVGDETCVYTYLHVREDIFSLYGFISPEEHDLFVMLLQVSGVGPKAAQLLVASLSPEKFALAVVTGDINTLTQVKGIGKKGAERLVVELKDKLKNYSFSADTNFDKNTDWGAIPSANSVMGESVSALVVLGYPVQEANKAVASVIQEGMKVEEVIRLALRSFI